MSEGLNNLKLHTKRRILLHNWGLVLRWELCVLALQMADDISNSFPKVMFTNVETK